MKTLRLAFSRIFTYFSENKLIFVLYFIGTIACILSMVYYYGNVLNYKTGYSQYDDINFRKFEVKLATPTEITPETLEKLYDFEQDYEIQDIILTTIIDSDGNNVDFSTNTEANKYYSAKELEYEGYDDIAIVETYVNNNNDVMVNPKPNIFTDEQLKQNVTIAPKETTVSLNIKGQTFNTIKNESSISYLIPSDAYFNSGIKTWKIKIYVSERFSENMMYRYADFLHETFNTKFIPSVDIEGEYDFVRMPNTYYNSENSETLAQFTLIIAVFAVSVISFMFLLKYLMDSCRRENSIYMMVGAKKKHILLINFIENIILTVSCTAIAIAIHALLYDSLFSKINLFENITYNLQDYGYITMMSLILSTIVQIPFIISYWFKNIRNIKEGSKWKS